MVLQSLDQTTISDWMFELFVSDYIRSVWLQSVFVSNEYAEVIGCNNINRGRRIRTMKVQKLYLLVIGSIVWYCRNIFVW
jgi:hypothetical protein